MKKLVLLVDDEDIIRLTSGEILQEIGFDVITAGTGREGLEIFNTKTGEIALVILDMTLPDISGMELLNEMKKIKSGSKFLLTSGYRQDMTGSGSEVEFIQKPYTITELNSKLNKLLG
jgi:DNA-binding NtrC family response regulator